MVVAQSEFVIEVEESQASRLAHQPKWLQEQILSKLSKDQLKNLPFDWSFWARPKQMAPPGPWDIWLINAGRGFGKTRAGAQWVQQKADENPGCEIAIVGPTTGSIRRTMVAGESGILKISPPWNKATYHPASTLIKWKNGSIGYLYSADEPDRLRGPNHHWAWADELTSWRYDVDAWNMLIFTLRLGQRPQMVITTTPKPTKLYRDILKDAIKIDDWLKGARGKEVERTVVVTRGSTFENRDNLAPSFFNTIISQYENTTLGRQEIYAEVLEDIEGALWKREWFQYIKKSDLPDMKRIVVAVDPAVTSNKKSNQTGICVAGKGVDNNYYIYHLKGYRVTPKSWAEEVIRLMKVHAAGKVIAEVNNGGEMVEWNMRAVKPDLNIKNLHASKGKRTRAENISTLYEQRRVWHVGSFPEGEEQMCLFTGDPTNNKEEDDMVDALVWALTDLSDNAIRPVQPSRAAGFNNAAAGLRLI
jgi:phage terminase large subunit-like protein